MKREDLLWLTIFQYANIFFFQTVNEAFVVVERLQFAEWAFYGPLAKEARRRSYLAGPSMFIRQTMLMRESAALVQAWPVRENRHLGSRAANKPSVTPRAARLV